MYYTYKAYSQRRKISIITWYALDLLLSAVSDGKMSSNRTRSCSDFFQGSSPSHSITQSSTLSIEASGTNDPSPYPDLRGKWRRERERERKRERKYQVDTVTKSTKKVLKQVISHLFDWRLGHRTSIGTISGKSLLKHGYPPHLACCSQIEEQILWGYQEVGVLYDAM